MSITQALDNFNINDPSQSQYNKFNNPAIQEQVAKNYNTYDDRPINSKGTY